MLKKLLLGLVGLFVLYVLVVWSGVLPRNTPEQDRALALLKQPYQYAHGKHNGYRDLWLIQYDIPSDKVAAIYDTEIKKYHEQVKQGRGWDFLSDLAKQYPKQELPSKRLCPRGPESCLAFVRANPDEARKTVAEFSAFKTRAEALQKADYIGNELDFNFVAPLPPLQGIGSLQRLTSALDFVDGKTDLALDTACRDLGSWRRLRARTDMLLVDMVSVSYAKDHIVLIAEMLAELPADHAIPASCDTVLAPIDAGEFDQCDVARGEFKSSVGTLAYAKNNSASALAIMGNSSQRDGFFMKFINLRASEARLAPFFGFMCAGQPNPSDITVETIDWIFDPVGVNLTTIAIPNMDDYRIRVDDFAGLLQTLRVVVWLRDKPNAEAAFAQLPEALDNGKQKIALDKTSQSLSIKMLARPQNNSPKIWSLPLAASRLATAQSPEAGAGAISAGAAKSR